MSTDTTSKVLSDLRQHFVGWILALISLSADSLAVLQWLRDDFGKFTAVLVLIGVSSLWLALFYVYGKKQSEPNILSGEITKRPLFPTWVRHLALSGIIALPLFALAGFWGWKYYQSLPSDKTIILVADFEGPEPQSYRVTETIVEQLREATKKYPEVQIKALGEMITAHQGSERARRMGMEQKASIMLWGWYSKTKERALVNTHFEILKALQSYNFRPDTESLISDVAKLESFEIQTQLSHKMSSLSLLTLGLIRCEVKDYEGAIAIYSDALKEFKEPEKTIDAALIYHFRGSAYHDKKDYDEAIADYDRALRLKPDMYEALLYRGYAYNRKRDFARAFESFNQIVQLRPDDPYSYDSRANAHRLMGNHHLALADLSRSIELRPDDPYLYYSRAGAHRLMGNHHLALADLSRSIELMPNSGNYYFHRGDLYFRMKEYDLALDDFNNAIRLKPYYASGSSGPDLADYHSERGLLFFRIGKTDSAIADHRRALALQPNDADTMNDVAWGFATHDQHLDEALKLSKRSLQLEPENAYYWDTLAEIYFRLNRFEEAKTANGNARRYTKDGDFKLIDERAAKIEAMSGEAAK